MRKVRYEGRRTDALVEPISNLYDKEELSLFPSPDASELSLSSDYLLHYLNHVQHWKAFVVSQTCKTRLARSKPPTMNDLGNLTTTLHITCTFHS